MCHGTVLVVACLAVAVGMGPRGACGVDINWQVVGSYRVEVKDTGAQIPLKAGPWTKVFKYPSSTWDKFVADHAAGVYGTGRTIQDYAPGAEPHSPYAYVVACDDWVQLDSYSDICILVDPYGNQTKCTYRWSNPHGYTYRLRNPAGNVQIENFIDGTAFTIAAAAPVVSFAPPLMPRSAPPLPPALGQPIERQDPVIDFGKMITAASTTGTTAVAGTVVTMKAGSPTWLSTLVPAAQPVNILTLHANFTDAGAEGLLAVYWDEQYLGQVDERFALPGNQEYSFVLPATVQPGTYSLAFRLDPYSAAQSDIVIDGVTMGYSSAVPEPGTAALLAASAVGLAGCAWRRRTREGALEYDRQ
jgi:hypothetical protein